MKYARVLFLLAVFGGTWHLGHPTCVLESDFGIVLNCAFKKSGLFRIRNLGGVKAHVGLGLTVGDELGFKESLTNTDPNTRRRSVHGSSPLQSVYSEQASAVKNTIMRPLPYIAPSKTTDIVNPNIPPFKPIPPAAERPHLTLPSSIGKMISGHNIPVPAMVGMVPSFNVIPGSISRIDSRKPTMAVIVPIPKQTEKLSNSNFAVRTLPLPSYEISGAVVAPQSNSASIKALSAATNVSQDAIEAALLMRQQQILQRKVVTTTSTSTTPYKPSTPTRLSGSYNKVMNAPKEYYPVGYDKNFDDNFASRVDLPETSFYCGEQKHFPGLYADEDLGCMVFHVCALTDDGLIMKSFLCPESTLFDQTILKCNYWFYVECRNSKNLYDSNIPVSKSYQLIKALAFFSSYKNETPIQKLKGKD